MQTLPAVFAHYDEADVWLAVEEEEELGYPYPSCAKEHAKEWVQRLFEGRELRMPRALRAKTCFS